MFFAARHIKLESLLKKKKYLCSIVDFSVSYFLEGPVHVFKCLFPQLLHAAEKGRSLLLNLLCQLPTKDISQALPCAQQFSVDTLFSKFQSFVFLFFYVRCKSAKCKLI